MKSNYGMVSAAALIIGLSGCSANKVAENVVTEEVISKVVVAEPEPIINTKSVLYKTAPANPVRPLRIRLSSCLSPSFRGRA